jgi:uncharacterized membrane protein
VDHVSEARESKIRSVAKALTYRITGTLTTISITYAVTGEAAVALAVGGVEPVVKITVYYLHERAWQRVPIGTMRRLTAFFSYPFNRFRRHKSVV